MSVLRKIRKAHEARSRRAFYNKVWPDYCWDCFHPKSSHEGGCGYLVEEYDELLDESRHHWRNCRCAKRFNVEASPVDITFVDERTLARYDAMSEAEREGSCGSCGHSNYYHLSGLCGCIVSHRTPIPFNTVLCQCTAQFDKEKFMADVNAVQQRLAEATTREEVFDAQYDLRGLEIMGRRMGVS